MGGPAAAGHIQSGTIGTEVNALAPQAMQDDTDAARQRDHCPRRSSAVDNLCGPYPEPGQTAAAHHGCRRQAQNATKIDVTGLGDPARGLALA